jgi:hypothetical protein
MSAITTFDSRLSIPPPPPECLHSPDTLRAWLQQSLIITKADGLLFGYSIGTMDAAGPEDRDHPRFLYDAQQRFLGLARWNANLQGWSTGGQIGQLMTLVKFGAGTVAADLAARPMAGWRLADGATPGIPDLRPVSPATENTFFRGTAPDWGVYTVAYTG